MIPLPYDQRGFFFINRTTLSSLSVSTVPGCGLYVLWLSHVGEELVVVGSFLLSPVLEIKLRLPDLVAAVFTYCATLLTLIQTMIYF